MPIEHIKYELISQEKYFNINIGYSEITIKQN